MGSSRMEQDNNVVDSNNDRLHYRRHNAGQRMSTLLGKGKI